MRNISIIPFFTLCICSGCSVYTTKPSYINDDFQKSYYSKIESSIVVSTTPCSTKDGKRCDPHDSATTSPSITISVVNRPTNKRYFYLNSNPFFSDISSISTSSLGALSNTSTQSQQQITSILSDLGTVAGRAATAGMSGMFMTLQDKDTENKFLDSCSYDSVAQSKTEINPAIFNNKKEVDDNENEKLQANTNIKGLKLKIQSASGDSSTPEDTMCDSNSEDGFDGFCAYDPSPVKISIECNGILLTDPIVVNVYKNRHIENPQRNVFTNPQDDITIQDGIVVGHKHTDQSVIKGIFDIPLSLLKSALPSTQTQNTTSVQTGGGKPPQVTESNQTQFKSQ